MAENNHQGEASARPNIVVIGGGTGCSTMVRSLKPHADIVALVGMVDDGGSTGKLRDEYGVLPAGDIAANELALSGLSQPVLDLFRHRFPFEKISGEGESSLAGHSLINFLFTAAEQYAGNFEDGLRLVDQILRVEGRVVPVTLQDRRLRVKTLSGRIIEGEHNIGEDKEPNLKDCEIGFDHPTDVNPKATEAIEAAELVVVAPGDLYTSIAPALIVDGVKKALAVSRAKKVYVANLVNKPNHVVRFTVDDYVHEVNRFVGHNMVDYVLYNTRSLPDEVANAYAEEGAFPVGIYEAELAKAESEGRYIARGGDYLSDAIEKPSKHDRIKRSFVRHHLGRISTSVMEIAYDVRSRSNEQ